VHDISSSRRSRRFAGTGKIALTLGLCLCAGQLVGTPAVATPTSTASPAVVATTTTPTTTTLAAAVTPRVALTASKRTTVFGNPTRLTAVVTHPTTKKPVKGGTVKLQAWRTGAWRAWGSVKLPATGIVAFKAQPGSSTKFRVQYSGVAGYKTAISKSITITVKVPVAKGAKILAEAKKHKGARYRFGASGPKVFDCSGFTSYVYRKAVGKKLPHKANSQQKYGKAIAKSKAKPGDLIVIRSGSYGYHAGVYAGGGYMYDAPRAGKTVGKHKIWSRSYVVRRLA
jgi:cell wall-associated NlpC family hydrolase